MRNRSLSQRPENFVIDPNHDWNRGLFFAGLGASARSNYYHDSSLNMNSGLCNNYKPDHTMIWDSILNRFILNLPTADSNYVTCKTYTGTPTQISVAFWATLDNFSSSFPAFISNADLNLDRYGFSIYTYGNRFTFETCDGSNFGYLQDTSNTSFPAVNTWTHWVCTYDVNRLDIYRNGILFISKTTGVYNPVCGTYPLRIGKDGSLWVSAIPNGKIADSLVWMNRLISLGEMQQLADPSNVMLSGLIKAPKRLFTGYSFFSPSTPETPTVTINRAIVKRPGRKFTERPENFKLNTNHSLATGLMFAGLQQFPGSENYTDSSPYNIPSKVANSTVAYSWIYDAILKRMVLQLDGTNDFVDITIPPVLSSPCSIVAWFNVASAATIYTVAAVSNYASVTDYHIMLELSRTTAGRVGASSWSTSGATAESVDSFVANQWFHGAAIFASSTSRTAYLNGKPGTANTTSNVPTGISRGQLGCNRTNIVNLYRLFSGRMSDILFYNRVLSLSEIQQLSDPSNVMLSGLLEAPKRKYYPAYSYAPIEDGGIGAGRKPFLRLSTYGRRSLFLWK